MASISHYTQTVGSLPREFINPARRDSSDESDEDEIEAAPTHELQVDATSKQTPEGSPLPSLKFVKELHPTKPVKSSSTLPRSLTSDTELKSAFLPRSYSTGFTSSDQSSQKESKPFSRKSSTDDEDSLTSSKVEKEEASPLGRGLSRRGAISNRNKSKMEESRRKAKQKRDSRSPSSNSGNESAMGDRSSSCKEESTASPSPVHVPHIRLRRPTDPAITEGTELKKASSESKTNFIEEVERIPCWLSRI